MIVKKNKRAFENGSQNGGHLLECFLQPLKSASKNKVVSLELIEEKYMNFSILEKNVLADREKKIAPQTGKTAI
ncbi:hypothetical protein CEXT_699821 [Caerostris extrusa]|uniref:Uncharacterized protein n=1 Tax=Caerostris extrusa TaxID=172846 RepID=A0AAV4PRL4_CAEEX|nr:hypothetical protein CEXT_699821 [Caerostris extrusa]